MQMLIIDAGLIILSIILTLNPSHQVIEEREIGSSNALNVMESDTTGWWNGLEPGPYAVGFEVRYTADTSRSYRKPNSGGNGTQIFPRPMQVSVWFPATSRVGASHMAYVEYANLVPYEEWLPGLESEESLPNAIDMFGKYIYARPTVSEDMLKKILEIPTLVIENAIPLNGNFPIILYGTGGEGHSFQNSVLLEYLASHGYIVAAVPSFSRRIKTFGLVGTGTTSVWAHQALQEQIRDMEFLIDYMKDYPNSDITRVGMVSSSAGGTADVIMAMENAQLLALVNFEGGISFKGFVENKGPDSLSTSRFQAGYASNLRVPILHMIRKLLVGHPGFNQELYDKAKFNQFYRLEFEGFEHTDFSSIHIYRNKIADVTKDMASYQKVVNGYNATIEYSVHFLNVFVKGQKDDKSYLMNDPIKNGYSKDVLTITRQIPDFVPPTPQEFASMLIEDGIEKARSVYKFTKAKHPDHTLINPGILARIGGMLYVQGRVKDALGIYELVTRDYPSASVHETFGRLLEKEAQYVQAKTQYEKALELNPEDQDLIHALERLSNK